MRKTIAAVALALALGAAPASAKGPALTVPQADLDAAFQCPVDPTDAQVTPLMIVTGTGVSGDTAYAIAADALVAYGHPVCYVNFPDETTADIQVSVQYLVNGLRREYAMAGRRVAVFGVSQGGLLPRFALTYWSDLQRKVSDVLAAAGTQHGTNVNLGGCSAERPCVPAAWQQMKGSKLLGAINGQPDETPGRTSYTTVRSLNDETVQPQGGKRPTSSLDGASNILIQDVCPGRTTSHIGTALDSVSFAAFADAIAHRGPADPRRLPADVCDHPYGAGFNEVTTPAILTAADSGLLSALADVPTVPAEPPVRRAFVRKAAQAADRTDAKEAR